MPGRSGSLALGLWRIRARPYTPRANGNAELFIEAICNERAYGVPFQHSEERDRWLPRYLLIYTVSGATQLC